jgi:hypothetical protein
VTLLRAGELLEWLPIIAAPFAVYFLTEGFTQNLGAEVWLILAVIMLANLAWLLMFRWQRRFVEFCEKYPGFRMKK